MAVALAVICSMVAAVADADTTEVCARSGRVLDECEVGAQVVAG